MGFTTSSLPRAAASLLIGSMALLATAMPLAPLANAQDAATPAESSATLTDGTEPVVVVTVASVNKLMQDVNYLTGVVGQPQFGGMFSMMAGVYAQGMDMDRPVAIVVPLVSGTPQPIALLPTSDIKPILKRLEAQTGPVDELDDGTLVVTVGPNTVYIKQNAEHAVVAQNRDALKLVPADPSGLYQGMGNKYNLAVRLQVQQIPVEIRNVLINQMRQGFQQAMAQQPDSESTRQMAENSIEQLERLVQETDELNLALDINQSERNIGLDLSFTAVSGTQLAAMYGGQQAIPSRFAWVIRDDAAAFLHSAYSISPEAIDQAKESLESSSQMIKSALAQEGNLTEDQLDEIELYVNRAFEIFVNSFAEGKGDMGALVLAGADQFQAVLGSFVADGSEVAALAKDLAKKVPDDPQAPEFKFDVDTYNGVTLHRVEGEVPEGEEEARKLFGDKIVIHIGTAPKAVYLALGRDSLPLLKEFISSGNTDAGGDRPVGQFKLRLLPLLELAQSVESNDAVAAMINALAGSPDQGELSVVSDSIPNGSAVSVKFGEGLLKAIGAAAVAGQRQVQPAF